MVIELSKTQKEILKDVALKGERTIYDIAVKDRIASRSTVSETSVKFLKLGLIEVKREEAFPKIKDNIKRYYGLTFRGLIAALKIEDVKLHRIQNRKELISSWIKTVKEVDSVLKISGLFGLRENERKQKYENFQRILFDAMESGNENLEKFLLHFDLEYSDNALIFKELIWEVGVTRIADSLPISRRRKRSLSRLLRNIEKKGVRP